MTASELVDKMLGFLRKKETMIEGGRTFIKTNPAADRRIKALVVMGLLQPRVDEAGREYYQIEDIIAADLKLQERGGS